MSISQHRLLQVLAVSALALGLTACGPNSEGQTAGQKLDNAVDQADQAEEHLKADASRAAESVNEKLDQAVDAAQAAAQSAADSVGDVALTAKVNAALLTEPELSALKINVDTKDGVVTLSGDALNQAAKERAETLVKSLDGVRGVNNLLVVQ